MLNIVTDIQAAVRLTKNARMTLTGVGCRLQTCSRLASERFDSAFCAPDFGPFMQIIVTGVLQDDCCASVLSKSIIDVCISTISIFVTAIVLMLGESTSSLFSSHLCEGFHS